MSSIEDYEQFAVIVEYKVQQLLEKHNYNSVGNFIEFYEDFKKGKESSLKHFFRAYEPKITPDHHTCVGLALELLGELLELDMQFSGLAGCIHIVSCEERIEDLSSYMKPNPDPWFSEKEHVLVAINLDICGRNGVMLLDPGYHIARVITVMQDAQYPHTGCFLQSEENSNNCRKEYEYTYADKNGYVFWEINEIQGGIKKIIGSLIYVGLPYLVPVDVTERRNLVYDFKSLISRNTKGQLMAGLYFQISSQSSNNKFTVFYRNLDKLVRERFDFNNLDLTNDQEIFNRCCNLLRMETIQFTKMLKSLRAIIQDTSFVHELLKINEDIYHMADL